MRVVLSGGACSLQWAVAGALKIAALCGWMAALCCGSMRLVQRLLHFWECSQGVPTKRPHAQSEPHMINAEAGGGGGVNC